MQISLEGVRRNRRRRAIAGIIAALLIVGLIFTVGLGYFLYQNQMSLLSVQAQAGQQASAIQSSREELTLDTYQATSGPLKNWLYVEIYNTGGTTTTVTSVFVSTTSGSLLSLSGSGSPYLVAIPDLSLNLPLTVLPGVNSTTMTSCNASYNIGCSIGINSTAFKYSGVPVIVSALTQSGNVFSVCYPTALCSTTTTSYNVVSTTSTASTSTSTTTVIRTSSTTLTTSATLGVGLGIGTNSLLLSMDACPGNSLSTTTCSNSTSAYQGGEVVLTINVANYATTAMSVYVTFQSVGTNGASVTNGAAAPCTAVGNSDVTGAQNIPAYSGSPGTGKYTCTFVAKSGPSGGTVTFIGYAVGTYTIAPAPPVTITSAESTSNPLPVGNVIGSIYGPWVLNYFSLQYSSSQNHTFGPASVIKSAGSTSQVIFEVQVTNTANASLIVMQYSYLQLVRIQQEMDYYIVQPVGTTWIPTLQAYTCPIGGSGAPGGTGDYCGNPAPTSCSTPGNGCVPVGYTVTLSFAACADGGTNFMWQNTGGGNSKCTSGSGNDASFDRPEGVVGFVVIVYGYYTGGQWKTYSQSLPSQGIYIGK